jgi:hypothetical protein
MKLVDTPAFVQYCQLAAMIISILPSAINTAKLAVLKNYRYYND